MTDDKEIEHLTPEQNLAGAQLYEAAKHYVVTNGGRVDRMAGSEIETALNRGDATLTVEVELPHSKLRIFLDWPDAGFDRCMIVEHMPPPVHRA
jgi:hypothetical protein